MRKILSFLVICAGLTAVAAPARADLAIGAGVSTLGFGVNVAAEVNSFLAIRLNGNYASFDVPSMGGVYPTGFGGIDYDVEGDYQTVGILADFHPLGISPIGSGLVLVGGVYYNQNEFTASTGPVSVNVGGTSYPAVDLVGTIAFDDFAPYLAIGYDSTFHSLLPVSFYARAGVLFQGSPSVTLVDRLGNASQPDLDAEARQMENDLSGYEYYPVFSLGVMVSF